MQIYKVGIPEIAIAPLASKLKSALYVGPTVWFVSGGSNIKLSVAVMDRLDHDLTNNLTVALADERYGNYDHPDSNWFQLRSAGFDKKNAQVLEVLKPETVSLDETVNRYAAELETILEDANEVVGQFGMGNDGHIAGILPGTPAADESLSALVTGYTSEPYTRITLTFSGIRRINSGFLAAFGAEKHDQLDKLVNQELPLSVQPAQIIRQLREAYVYNDQVEGKQQ